MIEIITLIVGIVLCLLGIMMIVWNNNIIIMRFESFQRFVRRNKKLEARKRGFAIYNAILYIVAAIPLLVVAIIGFVNTEYDIWVFIWTYIAVAFAGLIGILFSNISKLFIKITDSATDQT